VEYRNSGRLIFSSGGQAMTYYISICDDEQVEIKYLCMLINKWGAASKHTVVIETFESAEAFLFRYAEDKNTDILLLDIEMGKMNGVELAQHIRRDNESMQIVFITGFPDFIAQGYEVSALHYLMKPVSEAKLFSVLDKACKSLNKTERAIMFNISGEIVRIPVSEIFCVEAFAHSVVITTTTDLFDAKQSITEIENLLREGFIRCHRSYIVGLKYIKRITKTEVILDNGRAIPLSRRSYDMVNQAFIKFFKGE
jgi:DNA-binding LytR/AlgR family response regulator